MHAKDEERNQSHSNFVQKSEMGLCHYFGSVSHHGSVTEFLKLLFCI
jgi:hypothetical protein